MNIYHHPPLFVTVTAAAAKRKEQNLDSSGNIVCFCGDVVGDGGAGVVVIYALYLLPEIINLHSLWAYNNLLNIFYLLYKIDGSFCHSPWHVSVVGACAPLDLY